MSATAAMASDSEYILQLTDPETQIDYSLIVSEADFHRAQKDEQFASSLLFHAQCSTSTSKRRVEMVPDTQENDNFEEENDISRPGSRSDVTENDVLLERNNDNKSCTMWDYNEVTELIHSVNNHKDDLNHPRKRKHVFELVANDLISTGVKNITADKVKNKWKSLVRSYSKAKDNKKRTGAPPSRFQYFDIMDEILGQIPSNSCNHSLNSSNKGIIVAEDIPSSRTETPTSTEAENEDTRVQVKNKDNVQRVSEKRLRKEYIAVKKEEYVKRQKRHDERIQLEREKLELEKKKLELLEKFLNKENTK